MPTRSFAALHAACFLFLGARAPGLRVSRQGATDREWGKSNDKSQTAPHLYELMSNVYVMHM